MFGFYVSLDVKLIDGSPSADTAHPPLGRGSCRRVGINEGIQWIQVAEKFLTCNWLVVSHSSPKYFRWEAAKKCHTDPLICILYVFAQFILEWMVCFQQKGAYLHSVSSCGAWYQSEALASHSWDMWHFCLLPNAQVWCASCSWTGWRMFVRRWDRQRFHQLGAGRAGWLLPALPLQQVEVEGRWGLRNFPAQCSCACHFYYEDYFHKYALAAQGVLLASYYRCIPDPEIWGSIKWHRPEIKFGPLFCTSFSFHLHYDQPLVCVF